MEVYPTEWVCICVCVGGGEGALLVYALKTLSCNAKNIRTTGPDRDGAGCAVACSKFNEVWNARLLPQVWSQLAAGWQGKAGQTDGRTGLKCATNKCAQVEQAKAGGAGGQWGRGAPLELAALQLCQSQTQSRWRFQCEGKNSVRGVNSSSISSALVSGALLMPSALRFVYLSLRMSFLSMLAIDLN